MDDSYANGEMGQEQGEMGKCVKIHANPAGTFLVSKSEEPAPEDGQPAADMEEAMEMARQMMSGAPEGDEEMMGAAQSGYAKKAQPQMKAPNPDALFGE